MIQINFEDEELRTLYETGKCKCGRYKKLSKEKRFVEKFIEAIQFIEALEHISDLSDYGRFHYEKLKHNYAGNSSIRIIYSRPERLIFRETPDGISIAILELNQDHYGNLH